MSERFYDNLQGFSDLKYVNGVLYGRLNSGEYQVIPTEGNPGEDGTDGVNAYLYIAYASDDQGTAFSLIPAVNLKYIALLQSTTVISNPLASMFAGKWYKYIGDDGADGIDGVDGDDGLDAYVYVAYASDASGTAFNMTPSDSLKYRAEIHVSTPIASPGLSDFSGATWVKYIGNDGQNLVSSVNSKTGAVVLDAEDVGAEPSGAVSTHDTATDAHADKFGSKVDKITGKGLSTEDYTTAEKTKLSGIEAGAEVNVNADWNATSGDAQILNKPNIPDAQIQADWNQTTDTAKDFIKNKPTIPAAQVQPDWNATSGMGQILNKPTIPSKTSDLTNDSDFTTASAVSSGYVAKDGSKVLSDNNYDSASKTKLDNLANITTIGANLSLDSGTLSVNVSSGGTSITWHIIDTNTTASANHGYMIDASSGAIELTLPSSFTLGDTIPVRVLDKTNTITLKRNGNKIEGLDEDLTVDIDKSGFYLTASDATHGWIVTTEIPGGSDSKIFATCNGRLTLTTNVPVTTADVTSATTIYFTPYNGSQIALYDGASWGIYVFSELSLSLSGLTANTNFDIFVYNNTGTLTLEAVAWTNASTRATALIMQDGIYVKSGATTRRYLGTFRTTATTGQCEDSKLKRFVWNYYNQFYFRGWTYNTNSSWTYATGAWREFNNGVGQNRFEMVCGYTTAAQVYNGSDVTGASGSSAFLGVAMDSTTSPFLTKKFVGTTGMMNEWGVPFIQLSAGYHYFTMVEYSQSGTAYTNNGDYQSFILIQA